MISGQTFAFMVPGFCRPGGSKEAFFKPGMKYPSVKDAGKYTKDWKNLVSMHASAAMRKSGLEIFTGPVRVEFAVWRKRALGHFGTGRNAGKLKDSAPFFPDKAQGDLTKMWRSTEDGITNAGNVWGDDRQVCLGSWMDLYCDDNVKNPCVMIRVVAMLTEGPRYDALMLQTPNWVHYLRDAVEAPGGEA